MRETKKNILVALHISLHYYYYNTFSRLNNTRVHIINKSFNLRNHDGGNNIIM